MSIQLPYSFNLSAQPKSPHHHARHQLNTPIALEGSIWLSEEKPAFVTESYDPKIYLNSLVEKLSRLEEPADSRKHKNQQPNQDSFVHPFGYPEFKQNDELDTMIIKDQSHLPVNKSLIPLNSQKASEQTTIRQTQQRNDKIQEQSLQSLSNNEQESDFNPEAEISSDPKGSYKHANQNNPAIIRSCNKINSPLKSTLKITNGHNKVQTVIKELKRELLKQIEEKQTYQMNLHKQWEKRRRVQADLQHQLQSQKNHYEQLLKEAESNISSIQNEQKQLKSKNKQLNDMNIQYIASNKRLRQLVERLMTQKIELKEQLEQLEHMTGKKNEETTDNETKYRSRQTFTTYSSTGFKTMNEEELLKFLEQKLATLRRSYKKEVSEQKNEMLIYSVEAKLQRAQKKLSQIRKQTALSPDV